MLLFVDTWCPVTYAELLELSDHDPFVRHAVGADQMVAVSGDDGWACAHAWRYGDHWGGLAVTTEGRESDALAALLPLLAQRDTPLEWFSTPRGRSVTPPPGWSASTPGDWRWMWAERLTAQVPAPAGLVELDDLADACEIEEFALSHNPAFEGHPGQGHARLWLGVRVDGHLAAVGALHEHTTGTPHLAGLVVDTTWRRQGIGAGMVCELTRRALDRAPCASLGVDHDNENAIRLYQRLGYQTAYTFSTVDITRVS